MKPTWWLDPSLPRVIERTNRSHPPTFQTPLALADVQTKQTRLLSLSLWVKRPSQRLCAAFRFCFNLSASQVCPPGHMTSKQDASHRITSSPLASFPLMSPHHTASHLVSSQIITTSLYVTIYRITNRHMTTHTLTRKEETQL